MSKSGFEITYKGPLVKDGSMDVRTLAPSLLSLGNLFETANAALNGDAASIQVNVHTTFETGSFIVSLDVVQSLYDKTAALFSGHDVKSATDLQAFIFGDQIVKGLLWLLKHFGGKPPSGTTINNQNFIFVSGDGNKVEVHPETVALAANPNVRRAVSDVVQPIKRGSVEEIEIREHDKVLESVTGEDVKALGPAPDTQTAGEVLTDEVSTAALQLTSPDWEKKKKWVWRFTIGSDRLKALVADEVFRYKVHQGEPFRENDVLIVELRTVTTLKPDGTLQIERIIQKVLDHRSAPEQMYLQPQEKSADDDGDDETD